MTEFAPSEERAGGNLFAKIRQQQVILVASACVIALTVVMKNVLHVPAEILTRNMAVYTILYLGFLLLAFRPDGNYDATGKVSPVSWDVFMVLVTLTILLISAL